MSKKLVAITLLLILVVPLAQAIDRVQVLYPYDFDPLELLFDNPGMAQVPLLLCVNAENGFAITGRTFLGYRGITYAEVGWTFAPDNETQNFIVPSFVLSNGGYWGCQIDENAQPGGHIIYKFYY